MDNTAEVSWPWQSKKSVSALQSATQRPDNGRSYSHIGKAYVPCQSGLALEAAEIQYIATRGEQTRLPIRTTQRVAESLIANRPTIVEHWLTVV